MRSIIDILILPSYAKFIFNINSQIKSKILEMVYTYITLETSPIVDLKLFNFLKSYYNGGEAIQVNQSKLNT